MLTQEERFKRLELYMLLYRVLKPVVRDAFERLENRHKPTEKDFERLFTPIFKGIAMALDDGDNPEARTMLVRESLTELKASFEDGSRFPEGELQDVLNKILLGQPRWKNGK